MNDHIKVSEIFGPTLQGEGVLIGQPSIFVRTGGCDYRCKWCDTLHAVDSQYRNQWIPMSAEDIFIKVEKLSHYKPLTISLTGGNPAIQPLLPLILLGRKHGYRFALETQGSIAQDWFSFLDILCLSPKPPSSTMRTNWELFNECLKVAGQSTKIVLKFVIFDDDDYSYAKEASAQYPHLPVYLQPGNDMLFPNEIDIDILMSRMLWLTEKVLKDQWFSATVLPQLHVLIWGNKKGV